MLWGEPRIRSWSIQGGTDWASDLQPHRSVQLCPLLFSQFFFFHSLSGQKTRTTAAAIQTAPPVTHHQTAATTPARLQTTAAATATTTALPRLLHHPPLPPQTAQTQEAAAIQIKDLQERGKSRNEHAGTSGFSTCLFSCCFFFFSILSAGWKWIYRTAAGLWKQKSRSLFSAMFCSVFQLFSLCSTIDIFSSLYVSWMNKL